jgi:hypothetical protein
MQFHLPFWYLLLQNFAIKLSKRMRSFPKHDHIIIPSHILSLRNLLHIAFNDAKAHNGICKQMFAILRKNISELAPSKYQFAGKVIAYLSHAIAIAYGNVVRATCLSYGKPELWTLDSKT